MSVQSLADRIDSSVKDAQRIIDEFYSGFKGVKSFTDKLQNDLKKTGWVVGKMGRKRHLPKALLPQYTVELKSKKDGFNPLLGVSDHVDEELEKKLEEVRRKITKAKTWKEKDKITKEANRDGIEIINNTSTINRTMRQCLNACIQGSSGTMTKLAMIKITKDPELNSLGARLLCTIHDEVFCEAPVVNSERCGDRIGELMVEAAMELCPEVPWKCDPYVCRHWYLDECTSAIQEEHTKKGESFEDLCDKYPMLRPDTIKEMLDDTINIVNYENI